MEERPAKRRLYLRHWRLTVHVEECPELECNVYYASYPINRYDVMKQSWTVPYTLRSVIPNIERVAFYTHLRQFLDTVHRKMGKKPKQRRAPSYRNPGKRGADNWEKRFADQCKATSVGNR